MYVWILEADHSPLEHAQVSCPDTIEYPLSGKNSGTVDNQVFPWFGTSPVVLLYRRPIELQL